MPSVTYNIKITHPTTKLEKEFATVIADTLFRLPAKVKQKVIRKVSFALEKRGSPAIIMGYPNSNEPTIFLNYVSLMEKSDSYKMRTVAHEIAHFILKHLSGKGSKLVKEREKEVNDLCDKWGFGKNR